MLNFYSNYVFIDLIFSEKFYLISNTEEDEAHKANYNSVIIEIIKQSEKNYEDAISNAQKELEANLQKAIIYYSPNKIKESILYSLLFFQYYFKEFVIPYFSEFRH